ncbi:MAG: hypothetical protein M0Z76_09155 [Gammaproteobacteria bacterium]|nr:hypothetical protein [Gammaproteobacteria bacterium]
MNLVVLPVVAALVLLFGLRYLGRLVAAVLGDGEYNTGGTARASWFAAALSLANRLGALGTPLLLAGTVFGIRYGWAPVFLWILLIATTAGALMLVARAQAASPRTGSLTIDRAYQLFAAAVLALLWAGLAAAHPDALLGFAVLYLLARPVDRWLAKGPLEQAIGVLGVLSAAILSAVAGRFVPLAIHGPMHGVIGPWHLTIDSGAFLFYAIFCVLWLGRARHRTLALHPPTGTIGVLILILVAAGTLLGAALLHPTIVVPRLPVHDTGAALPMLASALPFGAALAPLSRDHLDTPSLRARYGLSAAEGAVAVIVLMGGLSAWPNALAWHRFYAAGPGPVALLGAAALGLGRLGQALGLTILTPLFVISLLLLIASAFESLHCRLAQSLLAVPAARGGRPLIWTALGGAGLWLVVHAGLADLVMGALLGLCGVAALTSRSHQLPPIVVSLSLVLLVPIDIALGIIGWSGPLYSPTAAGVAIVFMIEAAWIIWLWRTGSRFTDYASRRLRN